MASYFSGDLKHVQETLKDAAKLGFHEVSLGLLRAKRHLEKLHLLNRRKELFAELGRSVYEAQPDLPEDISRYFNQTEWSEILAEIRDLDEELKD